MAKDLKVRIIGDTSSLERSFRKAGTETSRFGKVSTGLKDQIAGVGKAFIGAAAAFEAGKFLKDGIDAAENLKKAQESLKVAIEHTGGSVQKLMPQYQQTAKAAAQFGMSQTDALTAMSKATLLTGDAEKAQRAYEEALVISKATGKDFEAVLTATSKAQDGMTGSLKRYGVILDTGSSSQEQMNQVMSRFGGQAEANTTASEKLHANFQNLQATIGTLLLPAFEKIVGGLNTVVEFLSSSTVSNAFHSFASTAVALMAPVVQWVKTNWPQIQQTIQQVMSAVSAVVRVEIAAVKLIWDNFGPAIIQIAKTTFQTIFTVVSDLMRAISSSIKLITDIIHGNWSAAWNDLKGIVSNTLGAVVAIVRGYIDNFATAASAIGKAFVRALVAGLSGLGDALAGAVLGPLDAVISKIRDVIGWAQSALSAIGNVISKNNAVTSVGQGTRGPQVPSTANHRAGGGPVTAGSAYLVGERGPELFVPGRSGTIVPGMSGGATYVFNFPNYVGSRDELIETVHDGLIRKKRVNGTLGLA